MKSLLYAINVSLSCKNIFLVVYVIFFIFCRTARLPVYLLTPSRRSSGTSGLSTTPRLGQQWTPTPRLRWTSGLRQRTDRRWQPTARSLGTATPRRSRRSNVTAGIQTGYAGTGTGRYATTGKKAFSNFS